MITQRMAERALAAEQMLFEVTGLRVYVAYAAELELSLHPNVGAFCCGFMSSEIKRRLPDRFAGDRAAIILNENCFDSIVFTSDDRKFLNSLLCHEGSHAADQWSDGVPVFEPSSPQAYMSDVQQQVELPPQEWAGHKSPAKWAGHESGFIRSLCHIRHRMNSMCNPVDSYTAFMHDFYQLSPLETYSETLADELVEREADPLGTILKSEPPSEFTELWLRDSLPGRSLLLSACQSE